MSSLLRSTKFVRYFTGAARTLILNSAKTAEVSSLINPKALSAANHVVMRDYATKKKTENLEPLLQRLDSEVRRFGRITKRDIDEVFDELRTQRDVTSSQSLLIIRCCGELVPEELPEQRTLLVQKIWSVLIERGVPMDISHYNALLRVYLENEHPFSPAQFLEELETKGFQPNRVTYQRLMWRYCQEGDVEGATKVLEKMRELNFPVSEPVLNALVMGHAFHGDTEGANAVLETMAGAGLQPSNRTYALLACGYAKNGDIEGVEKVIKTSAEKDALMSDKDILEIVEHFALGGHVDKVDKLFEQLHKGIGYNQEACNVILRLLNKGHEDMAKKIMKTMAKGTGTDTAFKGAFYIKQLFRMNKTADGLIDSFKELRDEGLVPHAIFIAAEVALQHGDAELAQKLFEELKNEGLEIRQHYYWPLLAQKGKEGDEEGLLQIIKNMNEAGLTPTGEALRDYVIPYLIGKDNEENVIVKLQLANVPTIHSARNLVIELLDNAKLQKAAQIAALYRPRGQYLLMARPLLNALNKTKDINSFVSILHVISSSAPVAQTEEDSANDDQVADDNKSLEVGRIAASAVKSLAKPQLVEELLKALHEKGLRISADSAENIQQYLGNNMTTELSELLAKLTSPDLERAPLENMRRELPRTAAQLEQLLKKVKSQDGTNIARIQKQLLLAYLSENNVEKVTSYISELKSSNFELTMMTLLNLFEFYCQNDDIEGAKSILSELTAKNAEFVLNNSKLVEFAYALVRKKQYDEAIQFLKDQRPKDIDNGFVYNSKCWQMLNFIAEDKSSAKVKEMINTLIENKYVEPSNIILGPLIKVHLLNDDLEGALKEFEYCCKNFRSTPWKGELLKCLIMKEDATKLQWVADISTQIHGEVNILHDLVLAFVECGRLRQARRILQTPGLHTRQKRLEDACLRYVQEGKSEHLEGLLEATKELSHIDRSNIFYHLLVTYCKADETDKALGLWTVLQEDGEIPSDQFLNFLGKHLKSKNLTVPFRLPNDHQESVAMATIKKVKKQPAVQEKVPVPSRKDVSDKIDNIINTESASKAAELALASMKEGIILKPSTFKYLLRKLAEEGQVDKIQQFDKYMTDALRKRVSYDDKLTWAKFVHGDGNKHIDELLKLANNANSEEDLFAVTRAYPRSNALALALTNEDVLKKCHNIAEIAASKGKLLPVNLLWMEYVLNGKKEQAESLWKLWLANADSLVFRRLLQESFVRKQPEHVEKLISCLQSNQKVTSGSVGNAYGRIINYYMSENNTSKAIEMLEKALKSEVPIKNISKAYLDTLKEAVEAQGKNFSIPI